MAFGYSVLMSVYAKETPEFLKGALDSIFGQTLRPAEVILVKDGPLTVDLERVINHFRSKLGESLMVIELEHNVGLGKALQIGLDACTNSIVARMDTDDIARPTRCGKQFAFLEKHSEIDVVGTWISEFQESEDSIYDFRILPTTHEHIVRFAKKRNPINHMTAMFRKSKVLAAGGYRPFDGFEDYDLWVRMLISGAKFSNLSEVLVNARGGKDQFERRGGASYALNELRFQWHLLCLGFINRYEFSRNVWIRLIARVAPLALRKRIYRIVRRA